MKLCTKLENLLHLEKNVGCLQFFYLLFVTSNHNIHQRGSTAHIFWQFAGYVCDFLSDIVLLIVDISRKQFKTRKIDVVFAIVEKFSVIVKVFSSGLH